jgi:hypothetical protein
MFIEKSTSERLKAKKKHKQVEVECTKNETGLELANLTEVLCFP